jgi:hypothetical protein
MTCHAVVLRKNSVRVRSLTDQSDKPSARPFYMHRWLTGSVVSVGFELVVEMNLVQVGTNEFFPQLVRLVASEKARQPRPYSHSKLGTRSKRQCSSELFPSYTPRFFPTDIRDGGRREPREPRPCSLGPRNVCRDLAAVGIPRPVQESPVRGSSEGGLGCSASPTLPGFCADVSRPAES